MSLLPSYSPSDNPVFQTMRFPFSFANGEAFLNNTRTMLFGGDSLASIAPAANRAPYFPFEMLPDATQQPQSGAPVIDCATGKCSDGSAPNNDNAFTRLNRRVFCGVYTDAEKRAFCDHSGVMKSDGTDSTSGLDTSSWWSWGTQALGFDPQKIVKQGAFVLLAIVLIYVAVRGLTK